MPTNYAPQNWGGAIYDYLQQMLQQRLLGGGGSPFVSPIGGDPTMTQRLAPGAPAPAASGPKPPTPPTPPPTVPQPSAEVPQRAGVSTKLSPSAPINFAWGAGTPQPYTPGISDVLTMSGAPPTREGFMGQAPIAGGSMAGGYSPSQPWENVANPGAFPSYWEQLQEEQARREREDPLWREKQLADIEAAGQVKAARGIAEAQMEIAKKQRQEMQAEIEQRVRAEVENATREKGAPLTPQEIAKIRDNVAFAFSGGFGQRKG